MTVTIDTSVWFRPEIGPRLPPSTRYVYTNWSHIADSDLVPHLHAIVCTVVTPGFTHNPGFTEYAYRLISLPFIARQGLAKG